MSSMITREEEMELILRAQAGDEKATADLLEAHGGYITNLTAKYASAAWMVGGFEELKQSAYLGALIALKKFDPSRGHRFMTYATYWMMNEIDEELAKSRHGFTLPREIDDLRRRILNTQFRLYQENAQWPTIEQVADAVREKYSQSKQAKVTPELVARVMSVSVVDSMDAEFFEHDKGGDTRTPHDVIENVYSADPVQSLLRDEARRESMLDCLPILFQAIGALNEFEKEVVFRRFGLPPYDDNSDVAGMAERSRHRVQDVDNELLPAPIIAQQMDVSLAKITSTLANAMKKMRMATNVEGGCNE